MHVTIIRILGDDTCLSPFRTVLIKQFIEFYFCSYALMCNCKLNSKTINEEVSIRSALNTNLFLTQFVVIKLYNSNIYETYFFLKKLSLMFFHTYDQFNMKSGIKKMKDCVYVTSFVIKAKQIQFVIKCCYCYSY